MVTISNGMSLSPPFIVPQNGHGDHGCNRIINVGTEPHKAAGTVREVAASYHAGGQYSEDEESENGYDRVKWTVVRVQHSWVDVSHDSGA